MTSGGCLFYNEWSLQRTGKEDAGIIPILNILVSRVSVSACYAPQGMPLMLSYGLAGGRGCMVKPHGEVQSHQKDHLELDFCFAYCNLKCWTA